ncbi:hypothetical protein ABZ780_30230 [Micromonospora sp. NPDC047467]|uniref:hypothetical protein n=1 Tax=Micromonospora sp. NPDC047467 TaxID=3154814 RepID=UPI0033DF07CF
MRRFRINPYRPDRRSGRAETERRLDAARADATVDQGGAGGPATPAHPRAGVDPPTAGASEAVPERNSASAADPLARLLAAAAAPARPGELAGEEAALAAFRAARASAAAPSVARRPRRRRLTTGALAWIGALAVTATAGAAFAAAAGLDLAPDPEPPTPTSAPPTSGGTETTPPAAPSRSAPSTRPSGTPSTPATPPAGAAPNGQLRGLCRAWQAKKPAQRDKALRTPAFQRLVEAAGGAGAIEAYCQRLVPEAKPGPAKPAPSAEPSESSNPPGSAKVKPSQPAGHVPH